MILIVLDFICFTKQIPGRHILQNKPMPDLLLYIKILLNK